MRRTPFIVLLVALAYAAVSARASASAACRVLPPVHDMACNARTLFDVCRLNVKSERAKNPDGEHVTACIVEARKSVQSIYEGAKFMLEGKPRPLEALEELNRYFHEAMDLLEEGPGANPGLYKVRLERYREGLRDRASALRAVDR